MKTCFVALCLLTAFLLVSVPAQALPTADEVLKTITDKTAKTKTMQGDMTSEMKMPNGTINSTGHIVMARNEVDKQAVQKFIVTMKMSMQQGETTASQEVKTVSNGETVWIEMKGSAAPGVQVMKMKYSALAANPGFAATPEAQLAQLKNMFEFTKVGEDTIDARKMFVLEGTPKTDTPQAKQIAAVMSKIKYFVDQENLTFRRMVAIDLAGNQISVTDMTNTKIDEKVDPKLFEYAPPAGAQVKDMSEPVAPAPDAPTGQ